MQKIMTKIIGISKTMQAEVPIVAMIVKNDQIIAQANNEIEKNQSCIAHAEMLAIEKSCKILKSSRLDGCDIYVNLEPCPMCLYALCLAKVRRIYFAAFDYQRGGISASNILNFSNHRPEIIGGVMEDEANEILIDFFKSRREKY